MWIDSHSHIWTPDTRHFPLATGKSAGDLNPPSFTDNELLALVQPERVERVVLIQHTQFYRFDNSYLLNATRRKPDTFRVIAMVDDRAPEPGAIMRTLLPLGTTGFRITPFIRKDDPTKWLTTPGMREMWNTAAATRQAMCCLIDPPHMRDIDAMCEQHPNTPVVIDHLARIGAHGHFRESDMYSLCSLARHANVHVKVSAFYALGKKQPPYLDLVPLIRRVFDAFGPRRLMWGSDSPYQLAGTNTYRESITLVRDRLDFLTSEDREELLRGTAERVFFFA
jgi:predicted TIM-barrel fold metal-dependent hydrolase